MRKKVPKIPHAAIVRAPGLLPMLYTTRELENELQIDHRRMMQWVRCGLPHYRDSRNYIWINGRECAAWIENCRKKPPKIGLPENEAYCMRCRKPVRIQEPEIQHLNGKTLLKGLCAMCGSRVNKGVRVG